MCAGNEIFFSMLYILNFYEGPFGNLTQTEIENKIIY